MRITAEGDSYLMLYQVSLARFVPEQKTCVGMFTATRLQDADELLGDVDLKVVVRLTSGKEVIFNVPQPSSAQYKLDTSGLYDPNDVASYYVEIARSEWLELKAKSEKEAADDQREEAAREKRERAFCDRLYRQTSTKKQSDLTVKQSQQIRACEESGYLAH